MGYKFNVFTSNFDIAGLGIGGSIGSGTCGSILYLSTSGVLAQDNPYFFYDDTYNNQFISTTLGSELLSNPGFTGGSSSWTLGSGWAYASNVVNKTGSSSAALSQTVSQGTGIFRVSVDISNFVSSGGSTVNFGNVSKSISTNETITFLAFTTSYSNVFSISGPNNGQTKQFTVDNCSVKRLSGGNLAVGQNILAGTAYIGNGTSYNSQSDTTKSYVSAGTTYGTHVINSTENKLTHASQLTGYLSAGTPLYYFASGGGHVYASLGVATKLYAGGFHSSGTSTLQTAGSLGLKVTRITSNTTLDVNSLYTQILCDGDAATSCTGTPSTTACSGYANQGTCENYDAHGGCSWFAGSSCSVYDNESGMGTCLGTSGCTAVETTCNGPGDQSTCEGQDDSYGGSCTWNTCSGYTDQSSCDGAGCSSSLSYCSWSDPDCYGGPECDAGDSTDQGTCEALQYFVSCTGDYCSGNYYTGSCTGVYGAACSGTATCTGINDSTNCGLEAGCSWTVGLAITLPQISTVPDKTWWFKNDSYTSSAKVVLNAYSGETIEGVSSYVLPNYKDSIHIAPYDYSIACSSYGTASEAACETGHTGCTYSDSPCSDFSSTDQSTCETNTGCTWADPDCTGTYNKSCSGTHVIAKDWRVFADRKPTVNVAFIQTASATVANTVTETALTSTGVGTLTIPAYGPIIGKTYKFKAFGYHSSTAAPNLTMKVKLGSTVILTTGTHAVHNPTNGQWELDGMFTFRTLGSSGTIFSQGRFYDATDFVPIVNTATTTISTIVDQAISITATWGTANAGNTITLTNLTIEELAI